MALRLAAAVAPLAPLPALAGTITNGDFSGGFTFWQGLIDDGAAASVDPAADPHFTSPTPGIRRGNVGEQVRPGPVEAGRPVGWPGTGAPIAADRTGSARRWPAAAVRRVSIATLTVLMPAASSIEAAEVCLPLPKPGGEPSRREVTVEPFGTLTLIGSRQGTRLEVRVQDASAKQTARGAGTWRCYYRGEP